MTNLPISRDQALALVRQYNSDNADICHYLESEAVMGALARRLGEDEQYWKMLGLLHDIDWGVTKADSRQHLSKAPEILKQSGFDDRFIQIVQSHGYGWDCAGLQDQKRTAKEEFALAASETVTGLIYAYGLMRKGLDGMDASGVKKKMKDKRFAASVNRDIIREAENLGITLDEFLTISIEAMQGIAKEIGF